MIPVGELVTGSGGDLEVRRTSGVSQNGRSVSEGTQGLRGSRLPFRI